MEVIMEKLVVLFVLTGILCAGQELHVKHAPSYVVFQQQAPENEVSSSQLPNVLAGALGLGKQSSAIQSKSMLKRPKANVLISVLTNKNQELPLDSMASFPVDWDMPFVDMEQLMNNIQSKFLDESPLSLDLFSDNQFFDVKTTSSLFKSLPTSLSAAHDRLLDSDSIITRLSMSSPFSLNTSLSEHGTLLAEMQMLNDVVSSLKKGVNLGSKTPDIVSVTVSGFKAIGDEHGINSEKVAEARKILSDHIHMITEDLKKIYKGNVMVEVLTTPVEKSHVRKTRSLLEVDSTSSDLKRLNLALDWDQDFPVAFNIVLGLMVILVIAVFLIAFGIGNMNPNLESILYRVPQDEHKKMN